MLTELRTADADDDPGIAAAYYLARIRQLHSFAPDRPAAIAGYRALLARHPDNFHAQLGAPKLAVLLLYDDVPRDEWELRVAEVSALMARLTAPAAQRDTRLILATALIRLRHDHARAYPLLVQCLEPDRLTRKTRLNAVLAQAAESAEALGRTAEAAAHFERFLAEFPQDTKADEIRRRLAGLQGRPGA